MSELTTREVANLNAADTARFFREAARRQRENKEITWEYGTGLVNIAAVHGDRIADAILKSAE